ncbi:Hypothetical protein MVR_LOCUS366 [uncultured virus]|nr:Hypothetical protein MVR_LOCUS366 [uncultured virus]
MSDQNCIELIENHPNFIRSKFMDAKAIIKISNNWVNSTNFTLQDNDRNYAKWKTTDESKPLIEAFKKQEKVTVYEQEVKSKSKEVQGIYVHPTVMALFMSWYSPDTAVTLADTLVMHDKMLCHLSKTSRIWKRQTQELATTINALGAHNNVTLRSLYHMRKLVKKTRNYLEEAKTNPEGAKLKLDMAIIQATVESDVASESILAWENTVQLMRKRGAMDNEFGWCGDYSLTVAGDSYDLNTDRSNILYQ